MSRPLAALLALMLSLPALPAPAETLQIPGPIGHLEGESLVPAGARHVLVLIPDTGPVNRDGNDPSGEGLSTDLYRQLAEALAAEGVASLRIDKRGYFGSAAGIDDPRSVQIAEYAADANAWLARAGELAPCVWLAGHGEGGMVALYAAVSEPTPPNLCGVILLASPGLPHLPILINQLSDLVPPQELAALMEALTVPADGEEPDLTGIRDELLIGFAPELRPAMIDLLRNDPADLARQWQGPALIVQGSADHLILPENAERLAAAMPQASRLDLEGATHMLKPDAPGNTYATYFDPAIPLHSALLPGILAFLAAHPPAR